MADRKWSDLAPRVASGVVLVLTGLLVIWAGGLWFKLFIALTCGGMVWELSRICAPERDTVALQMGGVAGLALALSLFLPGAFALPLLLAPSMVGLSLVPRRRTLFLVFCAMILISGYGMARLRADQGALWLGWLVAVVVVTDVAGYFAGRMIGGPKFWPRVSPKKTWSGTVAGWVAAGLVGLGFGLWIGEGLALAGVSVALSMASQMGDMAESALKRRAGVKDSSNLIPGHGGLMDRFDGMLGASLMLLLTGPWTGLFFIAG
ncbi:phosphatidate cytidylyltransferase [Pseudooceanicola antarcticus]|uniref:Phosphatidate cytidylyltransferase n=1 Tax=Pseudooceanicola antarcticus TaxID=1247613 RepID=A0A285IW86_9RHOB|nr:phosphatidate cytidylyltransferase [Pseudooceanicola antarcticus]PJE25970.1 phosphatidate cytidylyltransferase [Pseudooceanicola antarcticus]SNY52208.1 phosphatidate cytidylyltransferase [Pseudooceanicola antarcticus]